MSVVSLTPIQQSCTPGSTTVAIANPPMSYDVTLGTPTAQSILPPYPNLPAQIFEINGNSFGYNWNYILGVWKQI